MSSRMSGNWCERSCGPLSRTSDTTANWLLDAIVEQREEEVVLALEVGVHRALGEARGDATLSSVAPWKPSRANTIAAASSRCRRVSSRRRSGVNGSNVTRDTPLSDPSVCGILIGIQGTHGYFTVSSVAAAASAADARDWIASQIAWEDRMVELHSQVPEPTGAPTTSATG